MSTEIIIYNKNNVKFELVFNRTSIFFTRLTLPNVSYTYRNPLTNLKLALEDLAKFKAL